MRPEILALRHSMGLAKVWVLVIHHDNGENISVFSSREAAEQSLAEFCREWAAIEHVELGPGEEDDDAVLIDKYFSVVESESYTIEECEVE